MLEKINQLKNKLSELDQKIKQGNDYVTQIIQAIEKLSADKVNTVNALHAMSGQRQAYQDALALLDQTESEVPLEG